MSEWNETIGWFGGDVFQPNPVYHKQRLWDDRRVDGDEITLTTGCGIITRQWNRVTGEQSVRRGFLFRRDIADKFARPCRRCWVVEDEAA